MIVHLYMALYASDTSFFFGNDKTDEAYEIHEENGGGGVVCRLEGCGRFQIMTDTTPMTPR